MTIMTRGAIFACFMCFMAGGCMTALLIVCTKKPAREVLVGWMAYLAIALILAYTLGGALIL